MTHDDIINDVRKVLAKEWSAEEKAAFLLGPWTGEKLTKYHHNLGMWIRNHYKLWTIPWTPELRDGVDYSPYHPDQVSMTIIEDVWKRGLSVKVEE